MDEATKKTALRLIPYGMFVLGSRSADGKEATGSTVNWVTQASFQPPLVAVGVKADSTAHAHITESDVFSINVIGSEQKDMAFTFFKTHERDGNTVAGEEFEEGSETGSPLFLASPAWWECRVVDEVVEAGVRREDHPDAGP
jgi:flavin reductase (DIM6/NTAB) family NADH-FMN oxidoreductase RutF